MQQNFYHKCEPYLNIFKNVMDNLLSLVTSSFNNTLTGRTFLKGVWGYEDKTLLGMSPIVLFVCF